MKSILLTTTALVAFAGAAAADGHAGVSFSGSATLGYNTDENDLENEGFYSDLELDVSLVAALDNGITVTATADVDQLDESDYDFGDGIVLEIASEMASLTFGDTDPSADKHWSGVDGDSVGDFRGITEHDSAFDAIIRGEATMAGVTASVSYGVNYDDDSEFALGGLQVAAVADVAGFTVIGALEAEDDNYGLDQQFGISASGAVSGIDVMVSYLADDSDNSSIGVSASAPFGPVTVGGYFSVNDPADNAYGLDVSYADGPISVSADIDMVDDGSDASWEIDANYDTGMGAIIHAGLVDSGEDFYIAGTYDLGGGASLLVSYADDGDDDDTSDEIGEDDLQEGTTVEVSFSF